MTPAQAVARVRPVADAILPPRASALERAVLAAELARIADIDPSIVGRIWDPATCPAALLPFLAWANSVDVWNDDWSETVKRRVIIAAPATHRRKGTRFAIDKAVTAMGFRARVIEWWGPNPPRRRGTFEVVLSLLEHNGVAGQPILTESVYRDGLAAVRAAKPKSRTVQVILAAGFADAVGAASASDVKALDRRLAVARPETDLATRTGVASAATSVTLSRSSPTARPETAIGSRIGAASAGRSVVISRTVFNSL